LGPANICSGTEGANGQTTATLEALPDLADQLPDTEAFRQRPCARSVDRLDREGWVWVDLEVGDGGTRVLVAEDL